MWYDISTYSRCLGTKQQIHLSNAKSQRSEADNIPGYLAHTWNSAIKTLRYTHYARDPVATHVYKFKVSWASRKILLQQSRTRIVVRYYNRVLALKSQLFPSAYQNGGPIGNNIWGNSAVQFYTLSLLVLFSLPLSLSSPFVRRHVSIFNMLKVFILLRLVICFPLPLPACVVLDWILHVCHPWSRFLANGICHQCILIEQFQNVSSKGVGNCTWPVNKTQYVAM